MVGVNYLELCPAQLARIVEWWQRENDENVRVAYVGPVYVREGSIAGLRFELRSPIAGLLEHMPSPARVEWTSGDADHLPGYRALCQPCGWRGRPSDGRAEAVRQAIEHRCA